MIKKILYIYTIAIDQWSIPYEIVTC